MLIQIRNANDMPAINSRIVSELFQNEIRPIWGDSVLGSDLLLSSLAFQKRPISGVIIPIDLKSELF